MCVAEFGNTSYVDEVASATKSFLVLVAGVAVDEGWIPDVDGSFGAVTGLAEFTSDHNRAITSCGGSATTHGPRSSISPSPS